MRYRRLLQSLLGELASIAAYNRGDGDWGTLNPCGSVEAAEELVGTYVPGSEAEWRKCESGGFFWCMSFSWVMCWAAVPVERWQGEL